MSVPNCTRFLSECITCVPGKQSGVREDEMYGLYLSWCFLNAETPCSDQSLWRAISEQGYHKLHGVAGQRIWPGLAMMGPAAVDYILASQPSLI
jgi:hypothetical protein